VSNWDTYTKTAEVSTGGDYPEVEDDLYDAVVQDISEPTEEPNKFKQKDGDPDFVTRFYISWELTSGDTPATIRQYITLPPAYLSSGALNEKSTLHKVMTALGYDLSGRFKVNPPEWQGQEARVMVESPRDADGVQTGWPRITGVKPKRQKAAVAAGKPAAKKPTRGAAAEWEDED
jgi:hypothetical protein